MSFRIANGDGCTGAGVIYGTRERARVRKQQSIKMTLGGTSRERLVHKITMKKKTQSDELTDGVYVSICASVCARCAVRRGSACWNNS